MMKYRILQRIAIRSDRSNLKVDIIRMHGPAMIHIRLAYAADMRQNEHEFERSFGCRKIRTFIVLPNRPRITTMMSE